MLVHFGLENLRAEWQSCTAVIGTFDGVHLGHQAVLRRAVEVARAQEQPAIVVTFDRHPAAVLAPERCPDSLGTLEQNVIALRAQGLSLCLIMPFTADLANWSAEQFFSEVLVKGVRANRVVVGHDFGFGFGREGNAEWLQPRVETHVMPPQEVGGVRISSTEIRRLILSGLVDQVPGLLGRAYRMAGIVVPGQKLGRELGYPTVNVARSMRSIVPLDGVYAGRCRTPQGEFGAAISVGLTGSPRRSAPASTPNSGVRNVNACSVVAR